LPKSGKATIKTLRNGLQSIKQIKSMMNFFSLGDPAVVLLGGK